MFQENRIIFDRLELGNIDWDAITTGEVELPPQSNPKVIPYAELPKAADAVLAQFVESRPGFKEALHGDEDAPATIIAHEIWSALRAASQLYAEAEQDRLIAERDAHPLAILEATNRLMENVETGADPVVGYAMEQHNSNLAIQAAAEQLPNISEAELQRMAHTVLGEENPGEIFPLNSTINDFATEQEQVLAELQLLLDARIAGQAERDRIQAKLAARKAAEITQPKTEKELNASIPTPDELMAAVGPQIRETIQPEFTPQPEARFAPDLETNWQKPKRESKQQLPGYGEMAAASAIILASIAAVSASSVISLGKSTIRKTQSAFSWLGNKAKNGYAWLKSIF